MSETSGGSTVTNLLLIPWLAIFVAVKVASPVMATWSWWWLLFPHVPAIAFVFTKMGWL